MSSYFVENLGADGETVGLTRVHDEETVAGNTATLAGKEQLPWQESIMYEIFLRSFSDSNGDGIGDLRGATSRLEYLKWLGVDYVWITAFYASPLIDSAYDVTDHCSVHPEFGTLEDFDEFVAEAHRLGLRVLGDYVPAHTSDRHPWFIESASSRDNPKRDWFIWRDPSPAGGVPNNWAAEYGGSAWEWPEPTRQYYLHRFQVQQPYLNWRHPDVRPAMLDVLRFWLDRDIDGFRIDAIHVLTVDTLFRDNPANPGFRPGGLPSESLRR